MTVEEAVYVYGCVVFGSSLYFPFKFSVNLEKKEKLGKLSYLVMSDSL